MVSSDNSHQTKVGKVVGLLLLQGRGFETTTLSETQKEERLFVKRHRQHRPVQSESVLPLVFEKFSGVVSVPAGEEVPVVTLSASAPPVVGQDGLCDGGVSVEPGQELQGPPVTHISPGLAVRPQDLGLKQLRSGQVRSSVSSSYLVFHHYLCQLRQHLGCDEVRG